MLFDRLKEVELKAGAAPPEPAEIGRTGPEGRRAVHRAIAPPDRGRRGGPAAADPSG